MISGLDFEAPSARRRRLLRWLFPNVWTRNLGQQPRRELVAALACIFASIPQTMAYGVVALAALGPQWIGLGIIAGLLSSVLHGLFATVLGGNPSTVTGPRAATILVFGAMLAQLAALPGLAGSEGGPLVALGLAEAAVVAAGLLQILFAALRCGRLAGFVPYPVVAGFLNGSALLILAGQIKPLTGVPLSALADPAQAWHLLQPEPLALGLGTTAIMLLAARRLKRVPPALAGLAAGTVAYHLLDAAGLAGALGGTIGPLPSQGLPSAADLELILSQVSLTDPGLVAILAPSVLSMAALSTLDALLASLALDALTLRRSDGNRELLAQGVGNMAAGLLWMLPSSGSMARAGTLVRAGSRTALGPLLVALLTLVVSTGLGDAVAVLPRAVLAGLLVVVAIDLFDKWSVALLRRHWRTWPRGDLLAVAVVVVVTLVFNLMVAVAVGVLLALVIFVARMARSPIRRHYPATALAARIHGDPERTALIERQGNRIAVIELEGALFFGSVAAVEEKVEELVAGGVRFVVLDLKRVKDADASGARLVERLNARLARQDGALVLAYVERERRAGPRGGGAGPRGNGDGHIEVERRQHSGDRRLWRVFDQLGAVAALGADRFQPDVDRAVAWCEERLRDTLADDSLLEEFRALGPAILRGIDRGGLRLLRAVMSRHVLAAGEAVFRQGDPPDSVYFLASGQVEVVIDLAGTDRKLRVQTLTRGSVFGEMAVLDPKPRSASVEVRSAAVCYRLAAADFEALKGGAPKLAFRLLENIALIFAERLRATNQLLAELER